jgi:hypothetical protein
MENDELEGIFIGNNINNQVIYVVLYMFGLIFFIFGYWHILKEMHDYNGILHTNEKG